MRHFSRREEQELGMMALIAGREIGLYKLAS
jgi:hypothetical protein